MRPTAIATELRTSALVHARLLDNFIELTRTELERANEDYVRESLSDMLDGLRADRRAYGALGGLRVVECAA